MESIIAVTENLIRFGLLLQQDKSLPNVVSIVTGESLKMSWWSHPLAGRVFNVLEQLSTHPDVIMTKMISGKVTFVHRRLWPSVLTVGASLEDWQFAGLSEETLDLYRKIEKEGLVSATGAPAKELEQKMLIRSWQVHTESGEHRTMLETWARWSEREQIEPAPSVVNARKSLEEVVQRFGGRKALLPWNKV